MSVWTNLSNAALLRINEARIVSINDTGELAQRIRDIHEDVAREVLEEHDWGSATKRVDLTEVASSDPIIGLWEKRYELPADFIRATRVLPKNVATDGTVSYGAKEITDWRAENSRILVGALDEVLGSRFPSADGVSLVYVAYDETEMGRWSPTLKRAVAALLASRLAVGTVGSVQLQAKTEAEYERLLRKAQRFDTYREGAHQVRYDNTDHGFQGETYSSLSG